MGISFIEKQKIYIYKKVKNNKNTTIDFETKVAEPLEGCHLVSFVKLASKTSIIQLIKRSWILNSIRDEVGI